MMANSFAYLRLNDSGLTDSEWDLLVGLVDDTPPSKLTYAKDALAADILEAFKFNKLKHESTDLSYYARRASEVAVRHVFMALFVGTVEEHRTGQDGSLGAAQFAQQLEQAT